MSVTDILAELPKLKPVELEQIVERALELQGIEFQASPELLAAIEEAEAEPESGDISAEEVLQRIRSWTSK